MRKSDKNLKSLTRFPTHPIPINTEPDRHAALEYPDSSDVNSFTELATGLDFLNPSAGRHEESDDRFEITSDGFAISPRGQHSLILGPNLNCRASTIPQFTSGFGEAERILQFALGIRSV